MDLINKVKDEYESLCNPSKVFLTVNIVLLTLIFLMVKKINFSGIFLLWYTILWTYIHDALCINNYTLFSWGLVLGMYISIFLIMYPLLAILFKFKRRFS